MMETTMEFENVDMREIAKYLAINMSKEDQRNLHIISCIPDRVVELEGTARGNVGMAYLDTEYINRKDKDGKTSKVDKWSWRYKRDPNIVQGKKMMASMMKILVETVMRNHCYQFDGKLFMQQTGGPIGLKLTGVLARLVMLRFDKMYLEKLEKFEIKLALYKRYIDDINMSLPCLPSGIRFRGNKLTWVPDLVEEDSNIANDVRTASIMKAIANTVMPNMIVMEEDTPSAHLNGRLPVLDMEFWMEDNIIRHQFYKKPMASRKVTMARSALSASQKRNILVQEGLRRLSNFSPDLPWSFKVKSLNLLCIDMKDCEHSEGFRLTVMRRVVGKYMQNLANHSSGLKTMFRTKEEREAFHNTNGGRRTKSTWYRGDGTTTTTTVPATPGSQLAMQMKTALASCPAPGICKTKVLEGGGVTVQKNLMKGNPFPRQSCGREDCLLNKCSENGCRDRCYQESVGYCSTCSRCTASQKDDGKQPDEMTNYTYTGETARTVYTRSKQHLSDYRSHLPGRKPVESCYAGSSQWFGV